MAAQVSLTDLATFEKGPPLDWFAELRANDPVHWHKTDDGSGFWLITKNKDVWQVSRDWQTFSSAMERGGIMGLTNQERSFILAHSAENIIPMMDPPEHTKYRKVVAKTTLPNIVAGMEGYIESLSNELLDKVVGKGPKDFVGEVAVWLPLQVLAQMSNIKYEDRDQIFRWVNAITTPMDTDYCESPEAYVLARNGLQDYCREIYAQRKLTPGNDIVSLMITGEVDGSAISENKAVSFYELLVTAGSETTRTSITHAVLAFAKYPEQYRKLRASGGKLLDSAVEEVLRWSTPIMYFRREATVDTELRGTTIQAGDSVVLSYLSANRDEETFEHADEFDISRPVNRHVAFGGGGPHNCLGANLARLQIKTFLRVLVERVESVEMVAEPVQVRSNLMNAIKRAELDLHATAN